MRLRERDVLPFLGGSSIEREVTIVQSSPLRPVIDSEDLEAEQGG